MVREVWRDRRAGREMEVDVGEVDVGEVDVGEVDVGEAVVKGTAGEVVRFVVGVFDRGGLSASGRGADGLAELLVVMESGEGW